jgi:tetratricopeptide (TPR) repeat protein
VAGSTLSLLAFAALMAMAATGFAVVHRFGPLLAGGGGEGRIAIYRDAAQVATRAPWFGFGLGNFEGVFNLLRVQSAGSMTRMIHPESDWWWLAVETGFLGVGLAGMLVALVFRFLFVDVHQRGLAKGSAVLALLFLIHSFFDVGGHRMGTLWSCTYLVGLGIGAAEVRGGCVMPALLFRTAGLLFLGLAALRCQSDGLHPWMPTRASAEAVELALRQSPAPPAQKELLDRAIAWAPLAWNPYFERGLLGLQQGDTAAAEADFDRALYLEQSTIEVPRAIGQACRQLDPAEALTAWQELMRRAGDRRDNVYWVLLISIPDPKQRLQVSAFAGDDPDLQAIAVIWQSPENFDWMRRNFLQTNPSLAGVRPLRARQLFDRWNEIGDANELITAWPQHPEWKAPGWRAYVRALARTGAYDRAVQETLDEIPAPAEPSLPRDETLDEAAQDFRDNPADPYRGLMLYRFQLAAGQTDAARATLQQAGTMPSPPAALRYLLAQALLRDGQAEAAWKAAAPLLETDSP